MLRVATHEIFCKCCFTDEGLSQDDSDDVVVAVIRRERCLLYTSDAADEV